MMVSMGGSLLTDSEQASMESVALTLLFSPLGSRFPWCRNNIVLNSCLGLICMHGVAHLIERYAIIDVVRVEQELPLSAKCGSPP